MANLRAQVILGRKSQKPEDAVTNTWHFTTGARASVAQDYADIFVALGVFYNAINAYLSPVLSTSPNAMQTVLSEVVVGTPGEEDDVQSPPLYIGNWTLSGTAAAPIPNEVAVCLSMEAENASLPEEAGLTRPAARKRGRVYIGPWGSALINMDPTTKEPFVGQTQRDLLIASANAMATDLGSDATRRIWNGVYSRSNGTISPVVKWSVDDAFDTIRSRGDKARLRTSAASTAPAFTA